MNTLAAPPGPVLMPLGRQLRGPDWGANRETERPGVGRCSGV